MWLKNCQSRRKASVNYCNVFIYIWESGVQRGEPKLIYLRFSVLYSVNVSLKVMCWKLNSQCVSVGRWELRAGVWVRGTPASWEWAPHKRMLARPMPAQAQDPPLSLPLPRDHSRLHVMSSTTLTHGMTFSSMLAPPSLQLPGSKFLFFIHYPGSGSLL
jgi:hypothetical protein